LQEGGRAQAADVYSLDYLSVTSGTGVIATATVRLKKGVNVVQRQPAGTARRRRLQGHGQDRLHSAKTPDYSLRSVSAGQDAQGEVSVRVEHKGMVVSGKGTSTDIVEASARPT